MLKTKTVEEAPVAKRVKGACVHRWLLGEPMNGVIPARCKHCDATRGYPVNPEGNERFDDYRELTAASSYHWARNERKAA